MSKDRKDLLKIFLFVMLLGIILLASDFYQMSKLSLPDNIKNLKTFTEKMPIPKEIHIFEKDNAKFIEIVGHLPSFPATPSGHPIYIFDDTRTGSLLDNRFW